MAPRRRATCSTRALLALACVARAAAGAGTAAASGEYRDVCVVGAGPSGVAAALALAQKNKTVALLERLPGVGGQTFPSYTDPSSGFRLHMGAVVLVQPDYRVVSGFAAQLGLGIKVRLVVVARMIMAQTRIASVADVRRLRSRTHTTACDELDAIRVPRRRHGRDGAGAAHPHAGEHH
jgi:phytoene dehydrogenase-like protein